MYNESKLGNGIVKKKDASYSTWIQHFLKKFPFILKGKFSYISKKIYIISSTGN